jgi:hypothetical protein
MKKVIQIIDSYEYVNTNCFQHQLLKKVKNNFEHTLLQLHDLPISLPDDVTIFCTVKIRNVYKHIDKIANVLKHKNVLIYDQDPWESFIDTATYPNGYKNLINKLPHAEFINASKWWSKFVNDQGMKSHFCRMWVLPEYCTSGNAFENREQGLCFRGSVHQDRKYGIITMSNLGCPIRVIPGTSDYSAWLSWLQTQRAFFYDELPSWSINGIVGSKHIQKPKNVEIISQGCFIFHDATCKSEDESYELTNVPCDIVFESYEHCVELYNEFIKKPNGLMNEMINESVDKIKKIDGWNDVIKVITSHTPHVYM